MVLDCLRPVLDVLGMDENREAGRFLQLFTAMCTAAGVGERIVTHHTGHSGERARGDSGIRGWPEAEWRIRAEQATGRGGQPAKDPTAPQYFSAFGRDVSLPAGRLMFDDATRHMTYQSGTEPEGRANGLLRLIMDHLRTATGPQSIGAVSRAVSGSDTGRRRTEVSTVIDQAKAAGILAVHTGTVSGKSAQIVTIRSDSGGSGA